jgi:hypothetical protein
MANDISRLQIKGLHRLGDAYFADFSKAGPEDRLPELLAYVGTADRIGLHALLWVSLVCPRALFQAMLRCEEPDVPRSVYLCFGKLHSLAKALCSVLYFAKNDPRHASASPSP